MNFEALSYFAAFHAAFPECKIRTREEASKFGTTLFVQCTKPDKWQAGVAIDLLSLQHGHPVAERIALMRKLLYPDETPQENRPREPWG